MHAAALHLTDAAGEQAWIEAQLAGPVTAPQIRLWSYPLPGVVLGCSQRGLLESHGGGSACELVLRRAGGGAVLTGPWMLSASIILPPEHRLIATGTVSSYRWLGALHAGLLRDLGIPAHALSPAELGQGGEAAALGWACFGSLSPWEVVVRDRKIVGLAQLRRRNGVLLTSGTLLYPPEWELLCGALGQPPHHAEVLAGCTVSCAEALGAPVLAEAMARDLHQMLVDILGDTLESDGISPAYPERCSAGLPPGAPV